MSIIVIARDPCLHILDLHDNFRDDLFEYQWVIRSLAKPIDAPPNFDVREGDVLFFPDLNTGAGEFEGVRLVGPKDVNDAFPLLPVGIETPTFPTAIAANATPEELRSRYEQPFEEVLQHQGFSMNDLFGGADIVKDFWQSPSSQQGRRLTEVKDTWMIPLERCKWLGPTH
jgi:hypothetical protein